MKFHYAGKYSGNPDDLPHCENEKNAVQFKEAADIKAFTTKMNTIAIILLVLSYVLIYLRTGSIHTDLKSIAICLLTFVPHELLHAVCYKEDVYMYHDLKHMMLFVVGTERTSKGRLIFRSLLPSIVIGFIPFIIFMIHPEFRTLGIVGAFGITAAAGDFYNAFNAFIQMPKGAKAYYNKMDRYWYMPENH